MSPFRNPNLAFLSFLLGFTLNSCKKEVKQPVADFTTDKTEYVGGETIQLTNKSTDAATFRWTLPDGTTSRSLNMGYHLNVLGLDYEAQFKLEAFSEDGSKSDYIVKNIQVKAAKGQLVLHDGYYSGENEIFIDGIHMGKVVLPSWWPPQPPTPIPTCGQGGFPTFTLTVGQHIIQVTSLMLPWSKSFEIKSNECLVMQIHN